MASSPSTDAASTEAERVMAELDGALCRARERCDAMHHHAECAAATAHAACQETIRCVASREASLTTQRDALLTQMEMLRAEAGRLDVLLEEVRAQRDQATEALQTSLQERDSRKRQADQEAEKEAEWAEHMASAPAASQAIFARALTMLKCDRDGVPSLLGLSVIAMAKHRVPMDDPQTALQATAAATATSAVPATVSAAVAPAVSKVPLGLREYVTKLVEWAEPRLATAAKEVEDEQRRVACEAERAEERAAAKKKADAERAAALADLNHYQDLVRYYFPDAVSRLPVPPDPGVSNEDHAAHQKWQLQQTKDLLNRLRQRQIAKNGTGSTGMLHKPLEEIEPDELCCGISKELFRHPLTSECGHTFEKKGIYRWLGRMKSRPCPLCRKPLAKEGLTLNVGLQAKAAEWRTTSTRLCQAVSKKRARGAVGAAAGGESDDDGMGTGLARMTNHPHKVRLSAAAFLISPNPVKLIIDDRTSYAKRARVATSRELAAASSDGRSGSATASRQRRASRGSTPGRAAASSATAATASDLAGGGGAGDMRTAVEVVDLLTTDDSDSGAEDTEAVVEDEQDTTEEEEEGEEEEEEEEAPPPARERRRLTASEGDRWQCMCGHANEGRHCIRPLRSGSLCGLTRKMGVLV